MSIYDKRIGRWIIEAAEGRPGQEWVHLRFDYNGSVGATINLRAEDVQDLRYVSECLSREFGISPAIEG